MKKVWFFVAMLFFATTASAQSDIEECYTKASTTDAIRQCLKQELQETRQEYREALEKLTQYAAELDRVTGRNEAVPALEKANTAFDRYVSEQCRFDEAMMGSGTGAGSANLSCQINLLHIRMGSFESHLQQQ